MTLEYIIKHITDNDPYQVQVVKGKSPMITMSDPSYPTSRKVTELQTIANGTPGVYTVKIKQVSNHSADKISIFEGIIFGNAPIKDVAPTQHVDVNKIRSDIEKQIREENKLQTSINNFNKATRELEAEKANLMTASGKLSFMITHVLSGMAIPGLPMTAPLNSPPAGTQLSVEGTKDEIRVQNAVEGLLNVMSIEDLESLSQTLQDKPEYVSFLKQFAPNK